MGEITSVARNAKSYASLRTTIPISMVRQWNLKPKDKLYWEWEVRDGKMVAVVIKHEDKTGIKKAKMKKLFLSS